MYLCKLPALSAICLLAASFAWPTSGLRAENSFEALAGDYVVVAVRRNSFVAAPLRPQPPTGAARSPIGKRVSFTKNAVRMEGISCDDWQAQGIPTPVDFATDRLLADLRLPPTDSPLSVGDKRLAKTYRITCEGEYFTTVYQADRRVLALSWSNAERYLILEKPLSGEQVGRLQRALKSTKFYHGPVTATLDRATESAMRGWYDYRQGDANAAIPRRPAITENLLDTMKVLD